MRIENESKRATIKSYKEYKTKFTRNKKQTFMMFISIFFVLLLIFLGFARLMSPDIDISIGEDSTNIETDYGDDNTGRAGSVDDRLKALQEEDETTVEAKTEEDGLVRIPEHKSHIKDEELKHEDSIVPEEVQKPMKKPEEQAKAPAPQAAPAPTATPVHTTTAPSITARVVVGYYNTQAQADVAKGILMESGLGVTPHIKQMGAGYTLQVGAFSSKDTANNVANKLLMNNYPARVIVENH